LHSVRRERSPMPDDKGPQFIIVMVTPPPYHGHLSIFTGLTLVNLLMFCSRFFSLEALTHRVAGVPPCRSGPTAGRSPRLSLRPLNISTSQVGAGAHPVPAHPVGCLSQALSLDDSSQSEGDCWPHSLAVLGTHLSLRFSVVPRQILLFSWHLSTLLQLSPLHVSPCVPIQSGLGKLILKEEMEKEQIRERHARSLSAQRYDPKMNSCDAGRQKQPPQLVYSRFIQRLQPRPTPCLVMDGMACIG
ncbi:hypothetical protein GOODEAATRI_014112, partial [Goodea atripinnis]